ncbi:MAG: aminopeptidase P family protein [Chloroflexi bacterium]|nr:aminopeptidase P family protein [Chloroflexota bacterium]
MGRRLGALRAALKDRKLDALLVSNPENRRYLSGFTGSAGFLFVTPEEAVLATDFRYVEQAGRQALAFRVLRTAAGYDWFPRLVAEARAQRVGFEGDAVTVALHGQLRKALPKAASVDRGGVRLVATTGMVEGLRALKDPEELRLLQRAIDIADQAMDRVVPAIRPGDTEAQVAWRLEVAMRELGAEGPSFDTIVASGPNGALPHHRAGDRAIQEGEPVVVDMGARYQGYCSDLTRTFVVGPVDETFRRIYTTVLRAQEAALAQVRPGMTGAEADGLARKVIEEAGHGDHFGHSLGHGVGLAVHEHPRVGPNAPEPLRAGSVFTVEPGIYLSGWGGVRIEDVVLLGARVARPLSKAKKLGLTGG